jgi:hypothetical protein
MTGNPPHAAWHAREACLNTVMKSPQAVAVHDKQAWMSIFARYNIVEDPVGSAPVISGIFDAPTGHRGNGPLARFYECFIAPNQLSFHVDRDLVCGHSVMRDMTIEIRMSEKVTLRVPMHAHYELIDEDGALKVQHLAAHWELWPMLGQQMSFGLASLPVGMRLGAGMIRHLGWGGMMKFMAAMFNIGQTGKDRVVEFVAAFNQRAFDRLPTLLSSDFVGLAWPAQTPLLPIACLAMQKGKLTLLGKTLASGNYITASFALDDEGITRHGVISFEFNMHEKKIQRIRSYIES